MTETLKPCPFCSSQAVILKADIYIVMCGNTICPEQPIIEADSLENAIGLWNTRTLEESKNEEALKKGD